MDKTRTPPCRLCLETSDDFVNIFDDFQDSTIASVLTQHFWFQVHKNDGLPECVCNTCWTNTRTFHNFYTKIETNHRDNRFSANTVAVGTNYFSIMQERCDTPEATALGIDLNLVKYEEPSLDVIDMQINKDESSDDYSCVRSESVQTSDNDSPQLFKKTKEKSTLTLSKGSKIKQTDPRDNSEMDAQIREFFTMKCDICTEDFEFETYKEARKHYRKIHKTTGHLTCCGNKYNRRSLILEHIQHHLNPDAYRCDLCGKRFLGKRALKSHIKNHEPRSSRAFKCSLCSSSFTKAVGLKYHMQNTHASENGGEFPCEKCNKICKSQLSLASHIRFIHKLEPNFVCDTCARAFKTKTLLLAHMQVHSTTPLPKVQCNVCGAWLKHEMGLKHHQMLHDVKAGNCPICNKAVKHKTALRRHIKRVHDGERRHQCTLCDKAFKTAKLLKEHVAIHTGEYLYHCPYCEKTFKSNANMYAHRKKAHLTEWTRDHGKQVKET